MLALLFVSVRPTSEFRMSCAAAVRASGHVALIGIADARGHLTCACADTQDRSVGACDVVDVRRRTTRPRGRRCIHCVLSRVKSHGEGTRILPPELIVRAARVKQPE